MHELAELKQLLAEVAELMQSGTKSDRREAANKLQRVAAIATTLGFTIRPPLGSHRA